MTASRWAVGCGWVGRYGCEFERKGSQMVGVKQGSGRWSAVEAGYKEGDTCCGQWRDECVCRTDMGQKA